jgi:hypothetical protein
MQGGAGELADVQKAVAQRIDFDGLRRQFDGGDKDNFDQSEAIQSCLLRNAYFEEKLR